MKFDPYDITNGEDDIDIENSIVFGYTILLILSMFIEYD